MTVLDAGFTALALAGAVLDKATCATRQSGPRA